MLADDGIVFAHDEFFRLRARVLLGYIEIPGIRRAQQFDFEGRWFSHDCPAFLDESSKQAATLAKAVRKSRERWGCGDNLFLRLIRHCRVHVI